MTQTPAAAYGAPPAHETGLFFHSDPPPVVLPAAAATASLAPSTAAATASVFMSESHSQPHAPATHLSPVPISVGASLVYGTQQHEQQQSNVKSNTNNNEEAGQHAAIEAARQRAIAEDSDHQAEAAALEAARLRSITEGTASAAAAAAAALGGEVPLRHGTTVVAAATSADATTAAAAESESNKQPHKVFSRSKLVTQIANFYCRSLREVAIISQVGSKWRNTVLGSCHHLCDRLFDTRLPAANDLSRLGPSAYLSQQNLQVVTTSSTAANAIKASSASPQKQHQQSAGGASPPMQKQPSDANAGKMRKEEYETKQKKTSATLKAAAAAAAKEQAEAEEEEKMRKQIAAEAAQVHSVAQAKHVERQHKEIFAQASVILEAGTSALRKEVMRAFKAEYGRILGLGRGGCTAAFHSGDPATRAVRTVFDYGCLMFAFRNALRPKSWAMNPSVPIIAWEHVHLRFDKPGEALMLSPEEERNAEMALVMKKMQQEYGAAAAEQFGAVNKGRGAAAATFPPPPAAIATTNPASPSPAKKENESVLPAAGAAAAVATTTTVNRRVRPHIDEITLCCQQRMMPDLSMLPPALSVIRRCCCLEYCHYTPSQQARSHVGSRKGTELKSLNKVPVSLDDSTMLHQMLAMPRLHHIDLSACRITANVTGLMAAVSRKHIDHPGSVPVTVFHASTNLLYGVLDLSILRMDKLEDVDLSNNELLGPLQLELMPKALPAVRTFVIDKNPGLERGATTICVPLGGCRSLTSITLPQGTVVLRADVFEPSYGKVPAATKPLEQQQIAGMPASQSQQQQQPQQHQ